jgi:hypothetical protein
MTVAVSRYSDLDTDSPAYSCHLQHWRPPRFAEQGTSAPWTGPPALSPAAPSASSSATIPTSAPVKSRAKPPGSKQLRQQQPPQHIPDEAKSHLLNMYTRMLLVACEDVAAIWQLLQQDWRLLDWLEAVTDIDQAGAQALIKGVLRLLNAGGGPAREQVRCAQPWKLHKCHICLRVHKRPIMAAMQAAQ